MSSLLLQSETRNQLLRTLPQAAFARLQPHLASCSFERGTVLETPGDTIEAIYFPEPGLVTVIARAGDGSISEAGLIGPEGMTGLALLSGIARAPHLVQVQISCRTMRITADAFQGAIRDNRPLHDHLLRYAQAFSVQLAHGCLCNANFTIEQRLARWLLMCHDRVGHEDLSLTHEFLSAMLGVRRAGVTTALRVLELGGALKTRRGGVGIRDREVLLTFAGASYGATERWYRSVLG